MKDEKILHKGIDKRPFALFSRRSVFAVTNSRIINLQRGLIGGYTMRDYQWKDLKDAKISENVLPDMCGSTLTFTFSQFPWIMVYPDLKTASDIYKVAQLQEQAWEEKRREELERWKKLELKQVGFLLVIQQPLHQQVRLTIMINLCLLRT